MITVRVAGIAAVILSLFVVVAAPAAANSAGTAADPSATTARKVALGLSVYAYADLGKFDEMTQLLGGHAPAIWSVWSDWGGANKAFPTALVRQLRLRGATPLVFWQPVETGVTDSDAFTWSRILSGKYDGYIRAWATAARASGGTILLRFAHEMDGSWFPWGMHHFGNTPWNFKAAWRHVWGIFKGPHGVGATNVKFVWSPYRPMPRFYPGNTYVDWVGFSAFNWGPPHAWASMRATLAPDVKLMRRITKKHIIVCETATSPIGGDNASWIRDGYPAVYAGLRNVAAIVYFDIDMRPGQPDWRLEADPAAVDAYAGVAAQPAFKGGIPGRPAAAIEVPATTDRTRVQVTWTVGDVSRTGIAGYYLSMSGVRPRASAAGWSRTPRGAFTLPATAGRYVLYAWVKDTHGRISPRTSATTTLVTTPSG